MRNMVKQIILYSCSSKAVKFNPGFINSCPGCLSSVINSRATTHDYRCLKCKLVFKKPIKRLKKAAGGKRPIYLLGGSK